MCANVGNLPWAVRNTCRLPIGENVSPRNLDSDFAAIPRAERGALSRRALAALSPEERSEFRTLVGYAVKKDEVDQPMLELLTFFALGHHAMKNGMNVSEATQIIVTKGSGVGILYKAQ